MDQISTANIIDIAIICAGAPARDCRFLARRCEGGVHLLLDPARILLASHWADRWGEWVGDQTRLTRDGAVFAVSVAIMGLVSVGLGYIGCTLAGLPPADAPGSIGGFVIGATNAVFVTAAILSWARRDVFSTARLQTLDETELASRLSESTDWALLGAAFAALVVVVASWQVRRRRMLIVSAATVRRQADSGFRFRRDAPLAPEAEKLERPHGAASSWSVPATYAETSPLIRVADPSARNDRPLPVTGGVDTNPALWQTSEVVRCISCGQRIGDDDKFCPRCGRQLT